MAEPQKLHPQVLWAQTKESVFLSVDLQDVTDLKVDLTEDSLSFHGVSHGQVYEFQLPFSDKINKDASKYAAQRNVHFKLVKETSGRWKDLSTIGKVHWIKVDWGKWVDTDDEDRNTNMGGDFDMGGMNFGDMGAGMGGMDGDMGDMDDEDLPDLDGPIDGAADDAKQSKSDDAEEDDDDDESEE